MASSWPAAFDFSFPGAPYVDNTEFVLAIYANSWISAIQAIETGIGYGSGSSAANPLYSVSYNQAFSTITARIANVEATAVAGVKINSSAVNIQAVGTAAAAGTSGLAADARHVHVGVTSYAGRTGAVTVQGADFGAMFAAAGGLIVGTGVGTSAVLPVGPALSQLTVRGADPSTLQWQPAQWVAGDYKFTAALNFGNDWLVANGVAISRASFATLLAAITVPFTGTAAGTTISGVSSSSTALLSVGQIIEGPGLGTSTTITGVGATTVNVSNAPTPGAGSFTVFPSGNGNGSTTFNVPDMRGKFPLGAFGAGGNNAPTVGMGSSTWVFGVQGEASHSLSLAEGPQHNHPASVSDPGHQHQQAPQTVVSTGSTIGLVPTSLNQAAFSSFFPTGGALTGVGVNIATSGSGSAHNNMPPFVAGQWLIHT